VPRTATFHKKNHHAKSGKGIQGNTAVAKMHGRAQGPKRRLGGRGGEERITKLVFVRRKINPTSSAKKGQKKKGKGGKKGVGSKERMKTGEDAGRLEVTDI